MSKRKKVDRNAEMSSAKGFTCGVCSRSHAYPAYVFAHWTAELNFKCDCNTRYVICRGHAEQLP